jgi:hypothetical protein
LDVRTGTVQAVPFSLGDVLRLKSVSVIRVLQQLPALKINGNTCLLKSEIDARRLPSARGLEQLDN